MNKIGSGLTALALFSFSACHKGEHPLPSREISNQYLEVLGTEELLFTLPENFQKEEPVISEKPAKASSAELFRNDAGQWTLRYISSDGKAGSDQLSIDSDGEHSPGHHCRGGRHPRPFGHGHKRREVKGQYRLQLEISVEEIKDALRKPLAEGKIQ